MFTETREVSEAPLALEATEASPASLAKAGETVLTESSVATALMAEMVATAWTAT